jgi:phosphoribosyl-ATP pyrophosphohydrolase
MDTFERLTAVLKERRSAAPDQSYVASLYHGGVDAILKKLGEEATETIVAAKNAREGVRDSALVNEVADLWFHSLVLLVHLGHEPAWVLEELERRSGVSGLTEKARRSASDKPRSP